MKKPIQAQMLYYQVPSSHKIEIKITPLLNTPNKFLAQLCYVKYVFFDEENKSCTNKFDINVLSDESLAFIPKNEELGESKTSFMTVYCLLSWTLIEVDFIDLVY